MTPSKQFWKSTYDQCAPRLLAMCIRYVHDRDLAQDLLHEGFTTAIHKYDTYKGKGAFEGWLRKIMVNTVLLYMRKHKQVSFLKLDEVDHLQEDEMTPEEEPNLQHERQVIEHAAFTREELLMVLYDIPDHYRIVFNLYVIEGYQHAEIAALLNIPVGTSKSSLSRARKRVAELLYKKALDRKKNPKKEKVVIGFASVAATLFIDGLFKKTFAGHKIGAHPMSEGVLQKAPVKSSIYSVVSSNVKSILFGSVGLVSVIIIPSIYLDKSTASETVPERISSRDTIPANTMRTVPLPIKPLHDRHKKSQSIPSSVQSDRPGESTIAKVYKQVIIKKQVVVRDTIYVRKKNEN